MTGFTQATKQFIRLDFHVSQETPDTRTGEDEQHKPASTVFMMTVTPTQL